MIDRIQEKVVDLREVASIFSPNEIYQGWLEADHYFFTRRPDPDAYLSSEGKCHSGNLLLGDWMSGVVEGAVGLGLAGTLALRKKHPSLLGKIGLLVAGGLYLHGIMRTYKADRYLQQLEKKGTIWGYLDTRPDFIS